METLWQNLNVNTDQLPKVEDVFFQRHPPRYRTYRMVVLSIWILAMVIVISALILTLPKIWIGVAGVALLVFIVFSVEAIRIGYRKRAYALRQLDITYRKGWLFHSITTVPFNRIQHTDVSQGPLERRFSLCTLNIYTAGGSSSDLTIPGIEEDEARQLRDFIAKKASSYV